MRKNMGKHFVVWIKAKNNQKGHAESFCLLAMLVAVMSYELPSAKT